MISYLIVGSGYRAEYFGRAARTYPDLFRALFLCRSEEKVRLMREHTGIAATVSLSECLAFHPDFIVVAVDRGHMADVIEEWAGRGYPVVAETPVAADHDQLERIEALGRAGAKIVSCEQYPRQPVLAAGLREIEAGTIGTPTSLYISLLHDYHASGLIRRALQIGRGEPYTVTGACQQAAAARTDSTQLVPDVHAFPGHIACDSASRSEIVVPLHRDGRVFGVLDIDSPLLHRFTEADKAGLEAFARILEPAIADI